jgi:4-amino-4-deoxy-L-arabinose transferase-like glycosyltransferase
MQMIRSFSQYLKTSQGLVSLFLVLSCALVLAFFVGRTFICPLPTQYYPAFGPAKWIQKPDAISTQAAYFRKALYIDSSVQQAWIQLAATGNYDLYVNNILVDQRTYPCVRLTGAYDIKTLLSTGNNVIAVYVAAGTFPGPSQIQVRGAYTTPSSPPREFYSDSTWKVSWTPDGVVGSQRWYSPHLVDTLWTNAKDVSADERYSTLQPLAFDPAVIEGQPAASWITASNVAAREVSFTRSFQLPILRGETWLQVAANGGYDVIVNGQLAAAQTSIPQAGQPEPAPPVLEGSAIAHGNSTAPTVIAPDSGLPGSQTPAAVGDYHTVPIEELRLVSPQERAASVAATQADPMAKEADFPGITPSTIPSVPTAFTAFRSGSLDSHTIVAAQPPLLVAYNISSWAKGGANAIVIRVHSDVGPVVLCVAGHTYVANGLLSTFATDESWYVSSGERNALKGGLTRAVVVGSYGARPWGPLPQVVSSVQSLPGENIRTCARWAGLVGLVLVIVLSLWFIVPALCASRTNSDVADLWSSDALLHLPVTSLLLFLSLLSFDVRFPSDYCFSVKITVTAIALLLAGKLCLLVRGPKFSFKTSSLNLVKNKPDLCWSIALGLVVLTGLGIRAYGLLDASFAHDEASMARFSRGVLTRGVPYVINGSFTKWLTTYELVPYPLALFSLFLGPSVLAYRLPALIFGTLTIALIGWVGYRMFDRRTGFVAALVYAFLPSSVGWARDGFYPSQECFFALLTYWLFYEVVRDVSRLNYRYVGLSALAFLCTYLSWEGSGFILPSLFVTLVVMRWDSFDWMKDRIIWRWAAIVAATVIVQLCIRQLLMVPDYLGVGYDLSEVSSPAPVFLHRNLFKPFYYLMSFSGAENRVVLSVLALCGVFALRANRGLRYLWVLLVTLELYYTSLLPNYAPRYYFQAQPLLVLAAVGLYFHVADAVRRAEPAACPTYVSWVRACSAWALLMLVVASSNPYLLKVYRLAADETAPPLFERVGVAFKANYRDADLYVARHLKPGDIVITREPHVFAYYAKRSADYSTDTLLNSRLFYDAGAGRPKYVDKWYGVPSLRTFQELLDLQTGHGRSWIIKSKGCRFEFDFLSRAFFTDWGRSVFETSCEEVVLLTGVPSQVGDATTLPASVVRSSVLASPGSPGRTSPGPAARLVAR